jgi:hypothetical protein
MEQVKKHKGFRRKAGRIAVYFFGGIAAFMLLGAIYEAAASMNDIKNYQKLSAARQFSVRISFSLLHGF